MLTDVPISGERKLIKTETYSKI